MSVTANAQPNNRLTGRRPTLTVARAAYWVVSLLVVGLLVFNIPFQVTHNETLCSGPNCPSDQLAPADVAQLQQSGLSLGFYALYQVALTALVFLMWLLLGGLIFWRKSNDWFGIFTAITLALHAFSTTMGGPPSPAMVEHYPGLFFVVQALIAAGNTALYIFFCLFPDGHFVPRWIVWLLPLVIFHDSLSAFRPDLVGNDWYIFPTILSALLSQIYRYWRVSNAVQRQQTRWVVFGGVMAGLVALSLFAFFNLLPSNATSSIVAGLVFNTAWLLSETIIPLSIGMAILRSHLWDIDLLIRRALIYGLLTALLALVYLAVVVALQAIFTAVTGQGRSELVTVISTLVIAALFVPLRRRLQAAIDRRFYRRKYDAARTLAQFGASLRDDAEADLVQLSAHLLEAVDESMQPAAVSLWLKSKDEG